MNHKSVTQTPVPQPVTTAGLRYVVAATPRCGSTLLCEALASTGLLGRPLEYLHPIVVNQLSAEWGCTTLDAYLRELPLRMITSNGTFGIKVHWDHLAITAGSSRAPAWFHSDHPWDWQYANIPHLDLGWAREWMLSTFGRAKFIRMVRHDKISQAVSFAIATQTGEWSRRGAGGPEQLEQSSITNELIDDCLHVINRGDMCWSRALRSTSSIVVAYEDLKLNYRRLVKEVFWKLTGNDSDIPIDDPETLRQATSTSAAIARRYRSSRPGRTE